MWKDKSLLRLQNPILEYVHISESIIMGKSTNRYYLSQRIHFIWWLRGSSVKENFDKISNYFKVEISWSVFTCLALSFTHLAQRRIHERIYDIKAMKNHSLVKLHLLSVIHLAWNLARYRLHRRTSPQFSNYGDDERHCYWRCFAYRPRHVFEGQLTNWA